MENEPHSQSYVAITNPRSIFNTNLSVKPVKNSLFRWYTNALTNVFIM